LTVSRREDARGALAVSGGWESDQAPVAADLCGGHPLRLATWSFLLGEQGFDVRAQPGPEGLDYLVVGVLGDTVTASR